jgi:hypothetical protein
MICKAFSVIATIAIFAVAYVMIFGCVVLFWIVSGITYIGTMGKKRRH